MVFYEFLWFSYEFLWFLYRFQATQRLPGARGSHEAVPAYEQVSNQTQRLPGARGSHEAVPAFEQVSNQTLSNAERAPWRASDLSG